MAKNLQFEFEFVFEFKFLPKIKYLITAYCKLTLLRVDPFELKSISKISHFLLLNGILIH